MLTGSWPQNFRKKIEQKSKCKKDAELDQLKFGSWKSKKWLIVHCFSVILGLGPLVFFAEGKKREENRKDPPRKDRNQPQSQFVGDARFGEASELKNGLSLILNQMGKNQSKINCHSPLFVVLSCKAYPILIHYINDSTVV